MSPKKKKNTGRTVLSVLLALVLIGTALIAGAYFGIKHYDNAYDLSSQELIQVVIEPGSGTTAIANQLEEQGVIRSAFIFKFKTKFNDLDGKYQAGSYVLSPSMKMETIMEMLQDGRLPEVTFTVPEGMNLSQIAEKLAKDGMVSSQQDFIDALDDEYNYSFLPKSGYAVRNISAYGNRLEGYLYPETYRIAKGADAHAIIDTMLSYFETNIYDKFKGQLPVGYSMHEMVTLASLIEEECGSEKDRKTISGVFWNRLNLPMRLQSDVTIHYILGNDTFDKNLDSPYNTYKVDGLPAGPICCPSYNSIEAAFNPESHNYYYFVLKGDQTGECNFAETYAEHLINVAIYNQSDYNY